MRSFVIAVIVIVSCSLLCSQVLCTDNPFFFNQQAFQAQQQLIFGTQAAAGFNTGFNNGFNFGFNNGATNGFNLGFSNGNVNGFNFGLNNFANQFTNNFNNLFTNNLVQNLGTTFNNQFGKMTFTNGLAGATPVNANSAEIKLDSTDNNNNGMQSSNNGSMIGQSHLSGGMLALIVISGIIGGFLVGGAIVFGVNLYARNQLTKQARASVSKPNTINNNHNNIANSKMLTNNNTVTPQPLATGNITVGELKV